MDANVVVGVAVVALLVVVRHIAARLVLRGHGRFAWLMFLPTVLVGVAVVAIGVNTFARWPAIGVLLIVVGVGYSALTARFVVRFGRAASTASTTPDADERIGAMTDALADHALVMTVVAVAGMLVLLVGLVVWAVMNDGRAS